MRADDQRYFERLEAGLEDALAVARRARERGGDPTDDVEIPIAKDMADRVENILEIDGVAERVRELEADPDRTREEAALALAADFAEGTVGDYDSPAGKAEGAVRTAVALLTEGVVAAPLSGPPRHREGVLEARFEPLEVPLVFGPHLQWPEVEVGGLVVGALEVGVELPDVQLPGERGRGVEVAADGAAVRPRERDVGVGEPSAFLRCPIPRRTPAPVLAVGDVPHGGGHLERLLEGYRLVRLSVLIVE